jgi:hypothetical protein
MRNATPVIVWLLWIVPCPVAHACSSHDSDAATIGWLATGANAGVVQGLITLQSSLIAPTSSTTCTAGIGLGSLADPAPGGVHVNGLAIVVINSETGSRTPLPAFSFAPNATTTGSLMAGSGSSSVPNTNPLFDGSIWNGFSSLVDPFSLPELGRGEFTAFQFAVDVPEALLPLRLDAQFAGGEGLSDGTPIFDGAHPAQYFTAANRSLVMTTPVPEPSSIGLMAWAIMGMAAGCARTR